MPYKNGRPIAQQWAQSARLAGTTLVWYLAQWQFQRGVCAICKKPESAERRNGRVFRLAIDHNHTTMQHRGLLCLSCNTKLPMVEHPPAEALAYLAAYKNTEAPAVPSTLYQHQRKYRATRSQNVK